jgi:hypothetical protein
LFPQYRPRACREQRVVLEVVLKTNKFECYYFNLLSIKLHNYSLRAIITIHRFLSVSNDCTISAQYHTTILPYYHTISKSKIKTHPKNLTPTRLDKIRLMLLPRHVKHRLPRCLGVRPAREHVPPGGLVHVGEALESPVQGAEVGAADIWGHCVASHTEQR